MTAAIRFRAVCLCFGLGVVLLAVRSSAQDEISTAQTPAAAESGAELSTTLNDEQEAIRVRFDRFEDTLYKMARYLQKTEPARAELVLRALARSQEERVAERMALISQMLAKEDGKSPRYADAIEEQNAVLANLKELLTILRSEDILDENRLEQERLKELARKIATLIDAEKIHQADTQRGTPTDRVAQGQQRTAKRTDDVLKEIDEHDRKRDTNEQAEKDGKPRDGRSEGEEPKDQNQQNGKPGEKQEEKPGHKQGDSEQQEGKNDSERQAGENSPPRDQKSQQGQQQQEGQQQQGQQQQGQQQQGQQQQGQQQEQQSQSSGSPRPTPGREELEAARDKMERAIEELKEQNRENASKEQEEAIQKLIEAKERIEEMLRQLREEERELMLRALEARFQKMLQLQQTVLEASEGLNALAKENWQDREYGRCRDAAAMEREIALEADKALEVLRADGSSVAFPEAVEQIRTDVGEVAGRLGREDVGELTIAIEQEIIESLEEMILALQKEMEKIREQKGQQQQQGSPSEPGLVDQLAELKMLKTLQLRINRRTKSIGQLLKGEQATEPEVIAQLRELADRQGRLQKATYDLAAGKTAN